MVSSISFQSVICIFFFFKICLKSHKDRVRCSERSSTYWFTPQVAIMDGPEFGQNHENGTSSGSPIWIVWIHMLSPGCYLEAKLEMEPMGRKFVPIWNASVIGSSFACCVIVLMQIPVSLLWGCQFKCLVSWKLYWLKNSLKRIMLQIYSRIQKLIVNLRIPSKFHIGKISFIGDSVCQF